MAWGWRGGSSPLLTVRLPTLRECGMYAIDFFYLVTLACVGGILNHMRGEGI